MDLTIEQQKDFVARLLALGYDTADAVVGEPAIRLGLDDTERLLRALEGDCPVDDPSGCRPAVYAEPCPTCGSRMDIGSGSAFAVCHLCGCTVEVVDVEPEPAPAPATHYRYRWTTEHLGAVEGTFACGLPATAAGTALYNYNLESVTCPECRAALGADPVPVCGEHLNENAGMITVRKRMYGSNGQQRGWRGQTGTKTHALEVSEVIGLTPAAAERARTDPKARNTYQANWLREQSRPADKRNPVYYSVQGVCAANGQQTGVVNPQATLADVTCARCRKVLGLPPL